MSERALGWMLGVGYVLLMAYGVHLQWQIWHVLG
jgi:hypothetical protein